VKMGVDGAQNQGGDHEDADCHEAEQGRCSQGPWPEGWQWQAAALRNKFVFLDWPPFVWLRPRSLLE
jgi:hypothetical protein